MSAADLRNIMAGSAVSESAAMKGASATVNPKSVVFRQSESSARNCDHRLRRKRRKPVEHYPDTARPASIPASECTGQDTWRLHEGLTLNYGLAWNVDRLGNPTTATTRQTTTMK
jgi:hypothetical protein